MSEPRRFDPHRSALFTDLYELTMLQAYFADGMERDAVFEVFFRELPEHRNYVMAAGLDDVLDFLEALRFHDDDIEWLAGLGQFSDAFLERLRGFGFSGEVHAVPEGTLVFGNEPILQVMAPLPEAQLIETFVLNQLHVQSLAATKAARVVTAAGGRAVVDFGSRRSHGTDAALKVARGSYVAGVAATSNLAAARLYGIPPSGTMAHSFVQSHADEAGAFRSFAREFPETTLLVDTYDTLAGVRRVIELARELGDDFRVRAVRLDSGDLLDLSRRARALLDEAGLDDMKIIASSSLDEYRIAALIEADAPIDGFGVGTELHVSGDTPDIDLSYKLVAYAGEPRMKLSSGKVTLPGRKQVFREQEGGRMRGDTVARHDESLPGEPLLRPCMRGGVRLVAGREPLARVRERAAAELAALPPALRALERVEPGYPVQVSEVVDASVQALSEQLRQAGTG